MDFTNYDGWSRRHRLYCGYDTRKLPFIGRGTQGSAYLLPDHRVLKVFKYKDECKDQINTLINASTGRFFPRVYEYDDSSIIMEHIDGVRLDKFLKTNMLTRKISYELVELILDFIRLGFTKQDIRIFHIYVQRDESIRAIDPRKSYIQVEPYPFNMLKGIYRLGQLERFFHHIKQPYYHIYKQWKTRFYNEI